LRKVSFLFLSFCLRILLIYHYTKSWNTTNISQDESDDFWSHAQDNWLYGIYDILKNVATVIDLLDNNQTSVLVSLEEGSDRTTQVVSLVQLLMDPWYRTIYGFQSLIEKEWIKFGHKFSQRLGQSKTDSKKPEKAPYFLQFIDCV